MSDSPPAEPRTEAGQTLHANHAAYLGPTQERRIAEWLGDILAIEAEASRPPAAPDALREALEAIAADDALLDANEDAFNTHAARRMQGQARAALEAAHPAPAGPVLADTWRDTGNRGAAEYASLSRSDSIPEPE